jgi:hypothetical protein
VTNEQRREGIAGYFREAMTVERDRPEAVKAADLLCAAARGGSTYIDGLPQINPLITRRYATMAVGWLAIHGWSFPYGKPPYWSPGGCTIEASDLVQDDLAEFLFHRDRTP